MKSASQKTGKVQATDRTQSFIFMKSVYHILRQIVNLIPPNCWPKFKVRLLERAKLDSFGRAKLDTLSNRKGRGAVDFQAISHWPGNRAPESSLSDYASMLRCRARQLAASKPGTCSEPMSQKNARHDRVCRIGTFLKDVEATVLGTNREPHGLLQRFCDPPLPPHEVDSAAEFDLAGNVP